MLKIILVILMFVIAVPGFAEIHGFFEFGKALENDYAKAEIQLELHHNIWRFENTLYGGWETWFVLHDLKGAPFCSIYHMGYQIMYKPFYLEIEHFCNHPVYSTYNTDWWGSNFRNSQKLTTIGIGIKW